MHNISCSCSPNIPRWRLNSRPSTPTSNKRSRRLCRCATFSCPCLGPSLIISGHTFRRSTCNSNKNGYASNKKPSKHSYWLSSSRPSRRNGIANSSNSSTNSSSLNSNNSPLNLKPLLLSPRVSVPTTPLHRHPPSANPLRLCRLCRRHHQASTTSPSPPPMLTRLRRRRPRRLHLLSLPRLSLHPPQLHGQRGVTASTRTSRISLPTVRTAWTRSGTSET